MTVQNDGSLAADELKVGNLVTLSSNKSTGDRSLTEMIWEIVGVNAGHVLLSDAAGPEDTNENARPRLVAIDEYSFYAADHFASAWR